MKISTFLWSINSEERAVPVHSVQGRRALSFFKELILTTWVKRLPTHTLRHWQIWSIESWTYRHSKYTSTSMCPCRNSSFPSNPFQYVHMWLIWKLQKSQVPGCISWNLSFSEVPSRKIEGSRKYFWNTINVFWNNNMKVNKELLYKKLRTSKILNPSAGLVGPLNLAWSMVNFPNNFIGIVIFLDSCAVQTIFLHHCADHLNLLHQHADRE